MNNRRDLLKILIKKVNMMSDDEIERVIDLINDFLDDGLNIVPLETVIERGKMMEDAASDVTFGIVQDILWRRMSANMD
ncbi:hypothetical protein EI975_21245 [Bacillus licheniformis]|uniref:hypothetical protein n=1 Tax=Bacillus subtilis group TaxID=653685 RepID=UPI0011EF54CB|nr:MULTISPECIES: hypothetical protein [Bacillus subtilis group]KAA0817064.1 hypothetical protein EI974_09480 [Bacillus licheniformis]KAA0829963.1 hypothetical protein EI980_16465 [Bacillus licheniformis]KAA0835319.1 hypothetical protein EI979_20565 [Bacillus paralicheniformis]KAA0844475.1 hypothetical protein EI975_21245 [Bacillus licheniformis]